MKRSNPVCASRRAFVARRVRAAGIVAVGALAMPGGGAAAASHHSATAHAVEQVTITRDRAGIPHIRASDFRALGYGEGYAFSQDNLCTLAEQFVTVNGERSQYFGATGLAVNYSAGASDSNLDSDLFWRYVKASGLIQRELGAAPPAGPLPQVRQIYTGFAQGYNAYLRSGKLRDPRCKGKAWVRRITLTDLFLRGEQIVTEASAAQFISGLAAAAPPTGVASASVRATHQQLDRPALKQRLGDSPGSTEGSNGIGLGASDTRSGHGMLLANPHFPWRGSERFWMLQLTVPGQYDVEGGTLEGFPLVGIGFNRHLAWTHTVSTSRRFALFQLNLVPGDPMSYYVDGRPEKMGHVTVSLKLGAARVSHTFYTTRWGPVTTVPAAKYTWTTSHAYALYDAEAEAGPRAANQYLRMGQASSVQGLFKVESSFLATPTFNTVAADDRGNAYYGDVGATPNISQAKINTCLPAGLPTVVFAAARVVTLDGSRSSCAPDNDRGTPARGLFNASHLPHLMRRDYVENSNDSFWLANPAKPLTGFSPVIGLTDVQQGLRTRLGNEMIGQRVAGADGLGAPKFTLATLQAMWQSDRSKLAELVLRSLAGACRANPSAAASNGQTVDLNAACDALSAYNGTGALTAKGGWLFSEWNLQFRGSNFWADGFDRTKPLTTPSTLNTANPATLQALADAVLELKAHGLAPDASYGQVQHATRGKLRLPIHGCDTGCFNAIYAADGLSRNPTTEDGYGEVYTGSSLVMTTELGPNGPTSQGILTYSQATDPTSPWYANLTRLYASKRWVKLAYTPNALRRSDPLPALTLLAR
jgi:acyl-homoserine-lactone acylase